MQQIKNLFKIGIAQTWQRSIYSSSNIALRSEIVIPKLQPFNFEIFKRFNLMMENSIMKISTFKRKKKKVRKSRLKTKRKMLKRKSKKKREKLNLK